MRVLRHGFCRFINFFGDIFLQICRFHFDIFLRNRLYGMDYMEWIIWNGLLVFPAGLYDLSLDKK